MDIADIQQLLNTRTKVDPSFLDLANEYLYTAEQKERMLKIVQKFVDELNEIEDVLLEILQSTEVNSGQI